MESKLYLVSTPIGNYNDVTLRALDILRSVDRIVCEERKEALRFLSRHNIKKELIELNEHNESDISAEIHALIMKGESVALISDCGTPVFSDPGRQLVELCVNTGVEVIPVPGANSLLPALVGSGLVIDSFYYYGWLPQKKDLRRKELMKLKSVPELLVILDTPYRLKTLLTDIVKIFGEKKKTVIAFQLTMNDEKFYRGNAGGILKIAEAQSLKGEFVLLLDNRL